MSSGSPSAWPDAPPPRRAYLRAISLSLLSAVFPGGGQFLQGRALVAAFFLGLFLSVFTVIALLRAFQTFLGLISSIVVLLVIAVAASWDAMFGSVRAGERRVPRLTFAIVLIGLLVAMNCEIWLLSKITGIPTYHVPSTSMQPTILQGDHIAADLHAYRYSGPARGDVVVLRNPEGVLVIRRVIGAPGDVVSADDGVVSINGKAVSEPYIVLSNQPYGRTFAPVQVPSQKYFVMGDSRDIALDSRDRHIGLIDHEQIIGRVLYIVTSKDSQRDGTPVVSIPPVPMSVAPAS